MSKSYFFWKFWICLVMSFAICPVSSNAQTSDCEASGVVFGFFNGVQTTQDQALIALGRHIQGRNLYGTTTSSGERITYSLFYNDTQGFADFVETFDQRLQELGGLLAGRFELFFSATRGEGGWWPALVSAIPSLGGFLDSLFDLFRAALVRELTAGLGSPNMATVASNHQAQIDHWARLEQKMLFFAHSQGNLFVNRAYAHALSRTDAKSVRVVHVAPASPTLSGAYTLADKDLVINGLRLVGAVVPNTTEMSPYLSRPPGLNGKRDLLGHGLLEIYLNPAVPTAGRIREQVLTALRELESPPRQPMPPFPDFVANPWLGGPEPAMVVTPAEVSHRVDRIVEEFSEPRIFVKSRDSLWFERFPTGAEAKRTRTRTTRYFGPGMEGSVSCKPGLYPLEGWVHPLWAIECSFVRVPLFPSWFNITPGNSDELVAHRNAQEGTEVRLNRLTHTGRSSPVHGPYGALYVKFMSGHIPLWDSVINDRRDWQETFQVLRGAVWVNESASRQWRAAHSAYESQEHLRYVQYVAQKSEYEARRQRCEAPLPPPPPEVCVSTPEIVCPS